MGQLESTDPLLLCRYLGSLQLRREIHEGFNVIESWNSANDFISFGKAGEMVSNRADDQEISMMSTALTKSLKSCGHA